MILFTYFSLHLWLLAVKVIQTLRGLHMSRPNLCEMDQNRRAISDTKAARTAFIRSAIEK